jgi:hypothetical protein
MFRLFLVVPLFSLSFFVLSLQVVSLSGPEFIVLTPNLLFRCARSSLTGHIRPQIRHIHPSPDIFDPRPDISVLSCFNQFKSSEFQVCLPIHSPPSRQLSIGIRVILSKKEFNRLERRCRGPGMKMRNFQGSMIKLTPTTM